MSRFFIDRPVFAWVLALFVMLAGALTIPGVSVALFPDVVPPTIRVSASYPGAAPQMLDQSITSVLEQELSGAPGLQYFESSSDISGSVDIAATFARGTRPELALMEVQQRVRRVEARLPREVIQAGLNVRVSQNNSLMLVALTSPQGRHDESELGDYLSQYVINELKRVPGVGDVRHYGTPSAMRIWIDPHKLASHGLTAADVRAALLAQNAPMAAGAVGETPNSPDQQITATVALEGQLTTPAAFGAVLLRATPDGAQLRLRDVARIAHGSQTYLYSTRLNGQLASVIDIQLAADGNAISAARGVRERLAELGTHMPHDMVYKIPFDQSAYVKAAVRQVVMTLVEAVVLVFFVMLLFLHNLRYTLIPTLVVPIALLGTVATLGALGFSINILTLFGMVLAIGLLVDDAIVVVENVERVMREDGLNPRAATIKAMQQITGAIIGVTTVLTAVFLPMALLDGSVGQIYRQFSVSIVTAMIFSALAALTLTPALCATLLKPLPRAMHGAGKARNSAAAAFAQRFDRAFERLSMAYARGVARLLHRPRRPMWLYAALLGLLALLYAQLPTAFLPPEDRGYLYIDAAAPPGATQQRSAALVEQIDTTLRAEPAVADVMTVTGYSLSGSGQNAAFGFVALQDLSLRSVKDTAAALAARANTAFASIREGVAYAVSPPAIPGIGSATGFSLRLQDRAGHGAAALADARDALLAAARRSPLLSEVRVEALPDAPQVALQIDRVRAAALGVELPMVAGVLSTALGSSYVNDYPFADRMHRVIVQADTAHRMDVDDLLRLPVRSTHGDMVPLSVFATAQWRAAPVQVSRYNGFPAASIVGRAADGHSSGAALAEMERLAHALPDGFGFEWTGQSLEEQRAGAQLPMLLGLSLLTVLLCLAALYESWRIPFSVLLVVPLGFIGAVLAVTLRGMPNDVYFKIGLVVTIGLSAKNAILIVEFARASYAQGHGLVEAALAAARLRLRPIVMTSIAFMLGVVPLVLASGPGSGAQRALGTGVLGGMMTATVLAVFWVPVFFVVVMRAGRKARRADMPDNAGGRGETGGPVI